MWLIECIHQRFGKRDKCTHEWIFACSDHRTDHRVYSDAGYNALPLQTALRAHSANTREVLAGLRQEVVTRAGLRLFSNVITAYCAAFEPPSDQLIAAMM